MSEELQKLLVQGGKADQHTIENDPKEAQIHKDLDNRASTIVFPKQELSNPI